MLVPIASAIIMLLMAHSLLEVASKNGSTAVHRCLFKKAGTDADGKPLCSCATASKSTRRHGS
jgi:hypothetical protein